ncbi:MAG TPA: sigma-70 family RNA polymerase sigma factor [Stellaceae bacterium]|nr:sigma-70 family RNA polymerase sigma factor [Stellaceae bacterium]
MQTHAEASDLSVLDATEAPGSDDPEHRGHDTPSAEYRQQIEDEIPFLRRTVRRWHRDKADADDLVQDTLVQALANAHLWQPGTDLRAWLYTIMRNRFLAGVNKSARSASALREIAEPAPRSTAHASELRLLLRDLGAALLRLSSNQRSAVLLIGVEGKSYAEAAQSMGTSVGAVRSHLSRGRDRLKTAVDGTDTRTPFAPRPAAAAPSAVAPPLAASVAD